MRFGLISTVTRVKSLPIRFVSGIPLMRPAISMNTYSPLRFDAPSERTRFKESEGPHCIGDDRTGRSRTKRRQGVCGTCARYVLR